MTTILTLASMLIASLIALNACNKGDSKSDTQGPQAPVQVSEQDGAGGGGTAGVVGGQQSGTSATAASRANRANFTPAQHDRLEPLSPQEAFDWHMQDVRATNLPFIGRWVTDCINMSKQPLVYDPVIQTTSTFQQGEYHFTGTGNRGDTGNVTRETKDYQNASCTLEIRTVQTLKGKWLSWDRLDEAAAIQVSAHFTGCDGAGCHRYDSQSTYEDTSLIFRIQGNDLLTFGKDTRSSNLLFKLEEPWYLKGTQPHKSFIETPAIQQPPGN